MVSPSKTLEINPLDLRSPTPFPPVTLHDLHLGTHVLDSTPGGPLALVAAGEAGGRPVVGTVLFVIRPPKVDPASGEEATVEI